MSPITIAAGGVILAATAGVAGYGKGYALGAASVQQQWDKEKAMQMADHAAAQDAVRKKEQAWQASTDLLRQEKDREIRNAHARATALANSLRDRPERAAAGSTVSGAAGAGSAGTVCTGAELSRSDAEFLAREAARADELRSSLRQCLSQYESLKGIR